MQVFFWLIAVVAIVTALGTVLSRNPVHSALFLIVNLLSVSAVYAILHAPFLAVAQVIVYAGAIMVLFLFVVMLLNLKREVWRRRDSVVMVAALLVVAVFLAQVFPFVSVQWGGFHLVEPAAIEGRANVIGARLYSEYALLFQASGVLLMTALVGAVMLAQRRKEGAR